NLVQLHDQIRYHVHSTFRCAVVTGGNKGIGLEICRQLASKGILVVLTARNEKRGITAVENLRDLGLSNVVFHQLDVKDPTSIDSVANFVKTEFGKLDILVNNAGDLGVIIDNEPFRAFKSRFGTVTEENFYMLKGVIEQTFQKAEECLETNYYGTKRVTEALLPLLQLSNSARIVNVASIYGLLSYISNEKAKAQLTNVDSLTEEKLNDLLDCFLKDFKASALESNGWPITLSAYKVSKAAVNAYTRILARKFPKFRVNSVHPGLLICGHYSFDETMQVNNAAVNGTINIPNEWAKKVLSDVKKLTEERIDKDTGASTDGIGHNTLLNGTQGTSVGYLRQSHVGHVGTSDSAAQAHMHSLNPNLHLGQASTTHLNPNEENPSSLLLPSPYQRETAIRGEGERGPSTTSSTTTVNTLPTITPPPPIDPTTRAPLLTVAIAQPITETVSTTAPTTTPIVASGNGDFPVPTMTAQPPAAFNAAAPKPLPVETRGNNIPKRHRFAMGQILLILYIILRQQQPDGFMEWLSRVDRILTCKRYGDLKSVMLLETKLAKYALNWWDSIQKMRWDSGQEYITDWASMRRKLVNRFVPRSYEEDNFTHLQGLRQKLKNVDEYANEFYLFSSRVATAETEAQKDINPSYDVSFHDSDAYYDSRGTSNGNNSGIQCFGCGKTGYMRRECPNIKKHVALLTEKFRDHMTDMVQQMWDEDDVEIVMTEPEEAILHPKFVVEFFAAGES
ncbi:hypothetical protein GIB67_009630, partial [Kingdonia uniflora]